MRLSGRMGSFSNDDCTGQIEEINLDTAFLPSQIQSQPDSIVITLRPSIAQAAWSDVEAFGGEVRTELEKRDSPACLIDLSPMTYMGSSIVALIVRIWKVVQSQRGRMVVVCPNPAVLEVIRLAGLDKIWSVAHTVDDGRRQLGVRGTAGKNIAPRNARPAASPSSSRILYFVLGVVTAMLALMAVLLYLANKK